MLAARIIAAIENPSDVCVISARPYGQRAVLKYASSTGAQAIAGRFTPGNFTNYITRSFKEPRLIVVTDPRVDHQAIREASYVNIPVIALCDTDAPLKFVDVAIPTNNKARHAVGLVWWLLCREVLRLRGSVPRTKDGWGVMVDMFFYRDPDEVEKQQQEEAQSKAAAAAAGGAQEEVAQGAQEWEAPAATQAGGINPAVLESGMFSSRQSEYTILTISFLPKVPSTGPQTPPQQATGPPSPQVQVPAGVQIPRRRPLDGSEQRLVSLGGRSLGSVSENVVRICCCTHISSPSFHLSVLR